MEKDIGKKEQEILWYLAKAWRTFCELKREYPNASELDDFCKSIHQCNTSIRRFENSKETDKDDMTHMFDNVKTLNLSSPETVTPDYKILKDASESIAKSIRDRYLIRIAIGPIEDLIMARLIEAFYSK